MFKWNPEKTLRQVEEAFTVRDIMIPEEDIRCVAEKQEAHKFFEDNPEYDCAGIRLDGKIEGYFEKSNPETFNHLIRPSLISDGTRLLESLDYFKDKQLFFVLSGNEICGLVHYSDINNHVMRMPFYALIAAAEHHCYSLIKTLINDERIKAALHDLKEKERAEGRFGNIKGSRKKALEKDIDRGWDGVLYIDEILKIAQQEEAITIGDKTIKKIKRVRDRVSHNDDGLLVEKFEDVKLLIEVRDDCRDLLNIESQIV